MQKMAIPVKIVNSPWSEADSPSSPANLLPDPITAQYSPIIDEAYFKGANFVIKDIETGDKHNSPTVWNKYAKTNQYIAEAPVLSNSKAAPLINKNPKPISTRPIIILYKDEASLLLVLRLFHMFAIQTPRVIIKRHLMLGTM